MTHLPPLPDGTSTVDVVFPDGSLPPIAGVEVEEPFTSALGEPRSADGSESDTWTLVGGEAPDR